MSPKVGFAIVAHNHPDQLLRLVTTLDRVYDGAPIACHYDFTNSSCDTGRFPSRVKFARPHTTTRWAHISVVEGMLQALRRLRESSDPDWVILLSGSDYPVLGAAEVLRDLAETKFDAHIDHREIRPGFIPPGQTGSHAFCCPAYIQEALVRYYYYSVWLPHPRRECFSGSFLRQVRRICEPGAWNSRLILKTDLIHRLATCFRQPVRLFSGDVWFEVRLKAVDWLLGPFMASLFPRFANRFAPDEGIFHTALCNASHLKISPDSKRYSDWTSGGDHPKWLDEPDFSKIRASGAHFARKFHPDGRATRLVDRTLLNPIPTTV